MLDRRQLLFALPALGVSDLARPAPPRTYRYAPDRRGVAPRVDVFLPPAAAGAVLLVHGGAFLIGSRRRGSVRWFAEELGEVGLAALAMDYRLLGRGGRFAEALDDVLAAMRWWRATAPDLGVPDRLGVAGLSAGAALAGVAATDGQADAWVGFYGPYDFERLPGSPVIRAPTRWLLRTTDPDAVRAASPLARCTTPAPTLLVHGTRDRLVPIEHSEALARERQAAGLPLELLRTEHAHGFLERRRDPAAGDALAHAVDFLATHLTR
jgi:acetyl esterase/lipase